MQAFYETPIMLNQSYMSSPSPAIVPTNIYSESYFFYENMVIRQVTMRFVFDDRLQKIFLVF